MWSRLSVPLQVSLQRICYLGLRISKQIRARFPDDEPGNKITIPFFRFNHYTCELWLWDHLQFEMNSHWGVPAVMRLKWYEVQVCLGDGYSDISSNPKHHELDWTAAWLLLNLVSISNPTFSVSEYQDWAVSTLQDKVRVMLVLSSKYSSQWLILFSPPVKAPIRT